jgi:hypothetical protein
VQDIQDAAAKVGRNQKPCAENFNAPSKVSSKKILFESFLTTWAIVRIRTSNSSDNDGIQPPQIAYQFLLSS